MVCSDTFVEHERFDIPIIDFNFGKLFRLPISRSKQFPPLNSKLYLNLKKMRQKNSAFGSSISGSRLFVRNNSVPISVSVSVSFVLLYFVFRNTAPDLNQLFLFNELYTITFSRYKQFGSKLNPIFGFAKSFKYKPIFPLSRIPKLLVACVIERLFCRNYD